MCTFLEKEQKLLAGAQSWALQTEARQAARGKLLTHSHRAGAELASTPGFLSNWYRYRIQTQSSLRIWGQDRSYAGVEESGEGRQQPRAVPQRGRELGHPPEAPGVSTSLYESELGDTFTPQSPPTGTGDERGDRGEEQRRAIGGPTYLVQPFKQAFCMASMV